MIRLSTLLVSATLLFGKVEISGHLDLDFQSYLSKADAKHENSFTLKQRVDLNYEKDDLTAFVSLYAQEDYADFSSQEDTKRTFMRLDELYLKYDFENDSIQAGKSIKFWGALELRNIVDVFNPNELRDDMFKTNKLGVYNASYSHFTHSGEVSITVKLYEQNQKMAGFPYVYYIFPAVVNYDEELQTSKGESRASLYVVYNGSTDSEHALDYAFIYENGYDSQRYFTPLVTMPTIYVQNAYLVDKFMTFNTLVVDATLIKIEALYAKVDGDANVGDYSHLALGFEHTIENFYKTHALGLIGEYYKYTTYESEKYSDLQLFETMQDDLFLGIRYSFNDADNGSVVGGIVRDFEYAEELYYFKYESRFGDSFKVGLDYYYVEPSKSTQTSYALLGRHQRVALNIAYHF